MMFDQSFAQQILDDAKTGIVLNGPNPWDPQIHNKEFFPRVFSGGSLALGESYMDGWWDCKDLGNFYVRIARRNIEEKLGVNFRLMWSLFVASIFNLQTKILSQKVIDTHYEDDNTRAFEYIYDPTMGSSCAYFKNGNEDLETAQKKGGAP